MIFRQYLVSRLEAAKIRHLLARRKFTDVDVGICVELTFRQTSPTPTRAPIYTSRVRNHELTTWRPVAGLAVIADDAGPREALARESCRGLPIGSRRERVVNVSCEVVGGPEIGT